MRKQQEIWQKEHLTQDTLPTMANHEPASGVVRFVEWLKSHNISLMGKAVDIGCGKGRNAIYLAQQGMEIWGLEYIESAIQAAQRLAESKNVQQSIHFVNQNIDSHWKMEDNFFDITIDSFSSIDIETLTGRKMCRDEMYRTLKPGGYALVTVVSCEDAWEKELIANHPGPELNSTLWPQNGKFQKNYSEEEFILFYNMFEMVAFEVVRKPALKLGKDGIATNFWAILQKII